MAKLSAHTECPDTVKQMDTLINRRKFDRALRLGEKHLKGSVCHNVHVWFRMSLACRLTGHERPANIYRDEARKCPGYDALIEGDLLRDEALMHVRQGRPAQALAIIQELERNQHKEADASRTIVLIAVRARIAEAMGDRLTAFGLYKKAYTKWILLGEGTDKQWYANNLFHLFRHVMKEAPIGGHSDFSAELYGNILRIEPSRKRRIAAKLMWKYGRLGVWVADRLPL